MRLKGISWIEQHFEKVFAGLFAVLALGVLTWQFAGKPNTVTVGPKKDVPIESAYDDIIAAADRTKEAVQRSTIEEPVLAAGSDPISLFEKNYKGPIAPAAELAAAPGRGGDALGAAGTKIADRMSAPLAPMAIPPTSTPIAASYMSTVHPSEAELEGVAAVLPATPPYDKAFVSVEANFDGKKLKAKLEEDPDGPAGPIQPIRKDWWEAMQLLAFELEREELLPDGKWGNAKKVPAMPGRFSLLGDVEQGVPNMDTLLALRTDATERSREIRQPEAYDIWMGEDWEPPSDRQAADDAAKGAGGDARSQKLAMKRDLERRIATRREKREEMGPMTGGRGARDEPAPERRQGGGGGAGGGKRGAGGGGARGGGGGGGGGGGAAPPPRTYTDGQRASLDRQIADLEKQLAQVNQELGIAPELPDPTRPAGAGQDVGGGRTEPSIFEIPDLRLWAHDVTVERGRMYRYRATLVFNNPLFGKGSVMVPEQAEWARPTLVRSAPSDWSAPVMVEKETNWFIVGASDGSQLSRTTDARAELFVFTMGFWRRGSASIEPGDRIQAEVSVPDVSKLEASKPAAQPNEPPPPPGGARRGARQAGGADAPPPPEGRPDEPAPAQLAMVNRPIATDATLLGVGSLSLVSEKAATRKVTQAFLRLGDGSVQAVVPDDEKATDTYKRLSRSADLARQAGGPKEADRPREAPRERPDQDAPPPGEGGGGPAGGSGGG